MKKSTESVIVFISSVSLFMVMLYAFVCTLFFLRCFVDGAKVPDMRMHPVIRVLYYGSGTETISARFFIYDTGGRDFASIERSWNASSLSIDFTSASFAGKTYMFPLRIYSDRENYLEKKTTIRKGISLKSYYLDEDECMLLDGSFSKMQRKALGHLAVFAIWQSSRFKSRFSQVYTIELKGLESGCTYDILTDSKGSLSLLKM